MTGVDMEAKDVGWSRYTMRFRAWNVEEGFVRSREESLATGVFVGGIVLVLFYLPSVVMSSISLARGELQGLVGFMAREEPEVASWGRRLKVSQLVLDTLLLGAYILAVAIAGSRCRPLVGIKNLERYVAFILVLQIVTMILTQDCLLLSMSGWPPPKDQKTEPKSAAFSLLAFVVSSHSVLSLRWFMILPSEVAAALYWVMMCSDSSPYLDMFLNHFQFFTLLACVSFGRRRIEFYQRLTFMQIVDEKALRVRLEHRLESMGPAQGPTHCASSWRSTDVASLASSQLFRSIGSGKKCALENLGDMGFQEHWRIGESDLKPVENRIVGHGGFGVVLPATRHGTPVVVKASRTGPSVPDAWKHLRAAAGELRVLRRVRHPNIVTMYGACVLPEAGEIFLVLEYINGVTLDHYVDRPRLPDGSPAEQPSTAERCGFVADVCSALWHLHSQEPPIVHGDLKGSNILVQRAVLDRPSCKLLDFGLSRIMGPHARPLGGTLNFIAPEVIRQCAPPKPSADVFSVGRVLFLSTTGQLPLRNVDVGRIRKFAQEGKVVPLKWPKAMPMLEPLRSLSEECSTAESESRPTAEVVHGRLAAVASDDTWRYILTRYPCEDPEAGQPGIQQAVAAARDCLESNGFYLEPHRTLQKL